MAHEQLELPSGKVFTVKEPDAPALAQFFDKLGLAMDDVQLAKKLEDKTKTELLTAAIFTILPSAIVDPTVVTGKAGKDELNVTSIKLNDSFVIMDWVMEKLRLTDIAQQQDSFPSKEPTG